MAAGLRREAKSALKAAVACPVSWVGSQPTQEGCGERAAEDEALETQGGLSPVWAELSEGPIDM